MRRVVLLVASLATVARADDKKPDPGTPAKPGAPDKNADPRAVFDLPAKPAETLDCGDGTAFGCAVATDPLADGVPYALSTWLSASYLFRLPVADANQVDVASFALGASRDEAGVSLGGANGLENRWTIEGAPTDGVRTGAADTRVPLAFIDGISVSAGGFAARDRVSTGGTIDVRLRRGGDDHELDTRAWLTWSGEPRHAPIAPNSFLVRRGVLETGPSISTAIVATGPLGTLWDGKVWYAAGIAPVIGASDFSWKAQTVTDDDQDGHIDGVPGLVTTHLIRVDSRTPITWSIPVMARAGLDRDHHHVDLTLIGTAGTTVRFLSNATLQAGGVDATNTVGDAIATYSGKWDDVHARVQLAWHRNMHRESARDDAAANIPQLLSAYVPEMLADDPSIAGACNDNVPSDPYPMVTNCPVPLGWFASGGAGPLVDTTADRPSITADIAHRFDDNVVRAGVTGEDARLVTETRFTGGEQIRSLFPGHTTERHFIDPDLPCPEDITQPCAYADHSTLSFRTRYTAAYAEDTWRAADDVWVDGGLRWELMWVGPALHFSNELSPRLGMAWDPLGDGRSRVWTSMGRSFTLLPAGLGATILRGDRTADIISFAGGTTRSVVTGAPILVVPGIEPIAQDELTLGGEIAISSAVRATMWLLGRWLERGLDTTADGFDNPGHRGGEVASRGTQMFAVELQTSPDANLALRTGYMYGRTIGSWTGAFDPRQGAVLFAGSDFDFTSVNQIGPLPTDLGHRFYFEAERRGHLASIPVALSTRLTLASGRPRNVLADTDDGIVNLLPRGSAGRGPMLTQANVRLAATWHDVDFTLELFNVFDQREPTNLDEVFTGGTIHPVEGGTLGDLVFLKTENGSPIVRRGGFDLPTTFQPPFSMVLGAHCTF